MKERAEMHAFFVPKFARVSSIIILRNIILNDGVVTRVRLRAARQYIL